MMVIPFMSLYLTSKMGWSEGRAGFTIMFFGLGSVASSFLGGWASDWIGPYRTIFLSNILGGVGFIVMSYVESFSGLCLWIFLTSTFADAARPASFAAVTDYTDEDNVTRGISLMRMAINLGIAVGPAVGGFMVASYGYHLLFLLDGTTCIVAGLILLYLFRSMFGKSTHVADTSTGSSPYHDGPYMLFFLFNLINLTVFFQILYAVPLFFKESLGLSEAEIGLFYTMNGLLIFFVEMPLVFHYEKKQQHFRSLITGALIVAVAHLAFLLDWSPWWIVIAYWIPNAIGEIINFPFINTIAVQRSKGKNKGAFMGSVTLMFSLSFVFAPITGLPLLEYITFDQLWIGCMVVMMMSCVGLAWVRRKFVNVSDKIDVSN